MKTLKKVLSVVLALAMVLSMTAIASAKTDFSDDAKITDREAIEVMNKVGVFVGSNGAVNPTGTLSRAEAAKLITYLDLGKDAAEALPAITVFSDVKATDWEAKYVAYLKDAGYVVGVGANKFNPDNNVTGYEFAKMLLGVLGYDADTEKMIGTQWQIAIAKLMQTTGIGKANKYVGNVALTREQAARFCVEALKATMVEYDFSGATITVNGAVVKTGAAAASKVANTASKETIANDDYMQLGEKLYSKLTFVKTTADDFGRPAHAWKYENKTIGTYADSADYTYTDSTKGKAIYEDLGKEAVKEYAWTEYVDGKAINAATTKGKITATSTTAVTANGELVEFFVDVDAKTVVVVRINTYLAKVAAVTEETDRYITIAPVYSSYDPTALASDDFETEEFAAKDLVAFTCAYNGKTYDIETVELLTKTEAGTLTAYTNPSVVGSGSSFTAGGTEYKYSAAAVVKGGALYGNYTLNSSKLDVYLDDYGYALYVEGTKGETNYAVVLGVGTSASMYGDDSTNGATLLFANGETKQVSYKLAKSSGNLTTSNSVQDAIGDLVKYTVDEKGIYELTLADKNDVQKYNSHHNAITKGNPNVFDLDDDATLIADDNTVFFVAINSKFKVQDNQYGYVVPSSEETTTFKAYTGFKNVPSIATENIVSRAWDVAADDSNRLTAVYISTQKLKGESDIDAYIGVPTSPTVTSIKGIDYITVAAVIDGSVETLNIKAGVVAIEEYGDVYALQNIVKNADGYVTSATVLEPTELTAGTYTADWAQGIKAAEAGLVTLGSKSFAYEDDAKAYVFASDLKSVKVVSVDAIATDANDYAFGVFTEDTKIVDEFIIKKLDNDAATEAEETPAGQLAKEQNGLGVTPGEKSFTVTFGDLAVVEGTDKNDIDGTLKVTLNLRGEGNEYAFLDEFEVKYTDAKSAINDHLFAAQVEGVYQIVFEFEGTVIKTVNNQYPNFPQ